MSETEFGEKSQIKLFFPVFGERLVESGFFFENIPNIIFCGKIFLMKSFLNVLFVRIEPDFLPNSVNLNILTKSFFIQKKYKANPKGGRTNKEAHWSQAEVVLVINYNSMFHLSILIARYIFRRTVGRIRIFWSLFSYLKPLKNAFYTNVTQKCFSHSFFPFSGEQRRDHFSFH